MADTGRLRRDAEALLAYQGPSEPAYPPNLARALLDAWRGGVDWLGDRRGGNNAIARALTRGDEAIRYAVGPQGYQALSGAAEVGNLASPAEDMRDIQRGSDKLVEGQPAGLLDIGTGIMGTLLGPVDNAIEPLMAIFAGPLAKNADKAALARAETMEGEGAGRDEIWSETGWFRGPDGKWRFEIDDSGAKLSEPTIDGLLGAEGKAAGLQRKLMPHSELWSAYPDAGRIPSQFESHYSTQGAYRPGDPQERITVQGAGTDNIRSINLHEVQHAVQQREDFARGGSPEMFAVPRDMAMARINYLNKELSRLAREMDASPGRRADLMPEYEATMAEKMRLWEESTKDPVAQYRRQAGEVEARNVQTRRDMTPSERRATPPWATQDVPDAEQIVRFRSDGPQASVGRGLTRRQEAFRDYLRNRTFESEDEARRTVKYYVDKWNKPDPVFGAPKPEDILPDSTIDDIGLVRRGGKLGLSQKGTQTLQRLETSPEPIGNAPGARWGGRDLQDYRTVAKADEVVEDAYVPLDQLPQAKLAGGRTGYGWEELELFKDGDAIPPVTVRINKNGRVSIIDGNHRIQWFRDQGYDSIPAYVIRKK